MRGFGRRFVAVGVLVLAAGGLAAPAASAASAAPQVQQATGGATRLAGNGSAFTSGRGADGKKEAVPTPALAAQYRAGAYHYGPITVKAYEWWDAWVFCPSDMRATGGGEFNTTAGGITLHNTTAMDGGTGWKVRISSTVDATFTVYTVCYSGLSSYWHSFDSVTVPPGGYTERAGDCQGNQLLGGGGLTNTVYSRIDRSYPVEYYKRWRFAASNLDSVPQAVTAQAVCGSGINNYTTVTGPEGHVGIGQGLTGTSVVQCPAGTWIVGGGAYLSGVGAVTDSYPEGSDKWRVYFRNDSSQYTLNGSAEVVCGN